MDFTEHTITAADDAALVLTITRNGVPLDITGMTVKWTAVANHGDTTPAMGPITATLTTPAQGVATVSLAHAVTATLASHAYLWDAQVTDQAGKVVTVNRGVLHVLSSITV